MIIGKPITTMGGGGMKPQIIVNAPTGSTVKCDGITKQEDRTLNPAYRNLPSGYTQVEYIQSSGSQYIDTGISGGSNPSMKVKLNPLTILRSYEMYFDGKSVTGTSANTMPKMYRLNSTTLQFEGNWAGSYTVPSDGGIYEMEFATTQAIINGAVWQTSSTSVATWGTLTYYVFNSHNEPSLKSTMRLYYLEMYTDGTCVRDYVPCLNTSTNKYGLYDLVSNTFFADSNGGNFSAGDVVPQYIYAGTWTFEVALGTHTIVATNSSATRTKTETVLVDEVALYSITITYGRLPSGFVEVEYLGGTGTQYIDLNYYPNSATQLEVDFLYTTNSDYQGIFGVMSTVGSIVKNYSFLITPTGTLYYLWDSTSDASSYSLSKNVYLKGESRMSGSIAVAYVDGNQAYSLTINGRTATKPAFMFARNDGGTAGSYGNIRIKYLRVYESSNVREMIPCYCTETKVAYKGATQTTASSGTAGYYDLTNDMFYINSGSGVDFEIGNPV